MEVEIYTQRRITPTSPICQRESRNRNRSLSLKSNINIQRKVSGSHVFPSFPSRTSLIPFTAFGVATMTVPCIAKSTCRERGQP